MKIPVFSMHVEGCSRSIEVRITGVTSAGEGLAQVVIYDVGR